MTTAIPEEGSKAATPGRAPKGAARTRRNRLWMIGGLVAAVLALALAGSLVYTEESSFCQSCHEMGPYYRAWAAGPHGPHAKCVD